MEKDKICESADKISLIPSNQYLLHKGGSRPLFWNTRLVGWSPSRLLEKKSPWKFFCVSGGYIRCYMAWIDYIYIEKWLHLTLHKIQALHSLARRSKGHKKGAEVICSKGCFSLSSREDRLWSATWYTRWQWCLPISYVPPIQSMLFPQREVGWSDEGFKKKLTGCNYKKIWDPLALTHPFFFFPLWLACSVGDYSPINLCNAGDTFIIHPQVIMLCVSKHS